jgi:hypothetical protein
MVAGPSELPGEETRKEKDRAIKPITTKPSLRIGCPSRGR